MATRYHSFSVFMADVAEQTKQRASHLPFGLFVPNMCYKILKSEGGWPLLLAICAILILGPIAFGAAVGAFLLTPLGLIIMGFGGGAVLWKLYEEKAWPLAIKKVGQRYKERYERASGSHSRIDSLLDEAANDLYRELTEINF